MDFLSTYKYSKYILLFFLIVYSIKGWSQEKEFSPQDPTLYNLIDTIDAIHIHKIFIKGNKTTKTKIIQRELEIKEDDSIHFFSLQKIIEKDKNKIFNTKLFVLVTPTIYIIDKNTIDIYITVSERWYIFPAPMFEFADRNFNEWWYERGKDFRRTIYGGRIDYYNFRGRNETLKLVAQFGFTQKFEFGYTIPYLTSSQKFGIGINTSYATTKSVAYKSNNHKLEYIKSEDILRTQLQGSIHFSMRNKFYDFHDLEIGFSTNEIRDTIAKLNPSYFLNGKTKQKYIRITYSYKKDLRNNVSYPLTGYVYNLFIEKLGVFKSDDINQLNIENAFSKFYKIAKNFYVATRVKLKLSFPVIQPYINFRGLGYSEDFVRGYERYTIEGQHYFLHRTSLRYKIISGQPTIKSFLPIKQFNVIPFAIYVKTYADWGYVQNNMYYPENTLLTNRFLGGTGLGVDVVTFYDLVFRFEYSITNRLEKGFFFSMSKDI